MMKWTLLSVFMSLAGMVTSSHLAFANEKMPAIVKGSIISIADVPWQVLVTTSKGTLCGGTLITASPDDKTNYVLTAAHCVDENLRASDVSVTAGIDDSTMRGEAITASELLIHPDYNATNLIADIAILRVNGVLPEHAKPIALADANVNASAELEFSAGTQQNLLVSGWGKTSTIGYISRYLQSTYLDGVADRQCRWVMNGGTYDLTKANAYVCANQREGAGICNGDSGGPLVWQDQNHAGDNDRGYRLIGVVSFRHKYNGCGDPNTEDGFVQVSHYADWIRSSIKGGYQRPYETFEQDIFSNSDRVIVPPSNEAYPDASDVPPPSDISSSQGGGSISVLSVMMVMIVAVRRRFLFS
ncbi:S1 family peptidase [Enterovibrio sp. 27052020O]|uniref:S1 family peptidase n=1 Tax=Enterovibrio sp. 27052020O TaxID=3241166 RepID=UPI003890823F